MQSSFYRPKNLDKKKTSLTESLTNPVQEAANLDVPGSDAKITEEDNNSPIPLLSNLYHQSKMTKKGLPLSRNRDRAFIFKKINEILDISNHPKFDDFSISSLLSSLVYLNGTWDDVVNQKLDKKIIELVKRHLESSKPMDFSNIIWAFARLGLLWDDIKAYSLDKLFYECLDKKLNACNAQDIAKILFALSNLGIHWFDLHKISVPGSGNVYGSTFAKILGSLKKNINQLDSIGLPSLLLTLDRMGATWKGLEDAKLTEPLIETVRKNITNCLSRNVSNILVAFEHFGLTWDEIRKYDLDRMILKQIRETISGYSDQDISSTLWALTSMGVTWETIKHAQLDKLMLETIRLNVKKLSPQGISNIFWALSHLRVTTSEIKNIPNLAEDLIKCIQHNADKIAEEEKNVYQILLAQLWYNFKLDPHVQGKLEVAAHKQGKPKSSKLHKGISEKIQHMTCEDIEDEFCYKNLIWVDMYLKNSNVVIEVDGPYHSPHLDKFKEDLLLQLGVKKVIRIKYTDKLDSVSLEQLLRKHGIKIDFNSKTNTEKKTASILGADDSINDQRRKTEEASFDDASKNSKIDSVVDFDIECTTFATQNKPEKRKPAKKSTKQKEEEANFEVTPTSNNFSSLTRYSPPNIRTNSPNQKNLRTSDAKKHTNRKIPNLPHQKQQDTKNSVKRSFSPTLNAKSSNAGFFAQCNSAAVVTASLVGFGAGVIGVTMYYNLNNFKC